VVRLTLPYASEANPRMFRSPDGTEKVPFPSPSLVLSDILDDDSIRDVAYISHQTGIELKDLASYAIKTLYDMLGDVPVEFLRRQVTLSKIVRMDEEIKAEMAELRKLKKSVPEECIKAQLRVLRDRLSHEDIINAYDDSEENVMQFALNAADWLFCTEYPGSDINPDETPSSAWKRWITENKVAA